MCLVFTALLQQEIFYSNVFLPALQTLGFENDFLCHEGSTKLNRPLVKFLKHGNHCLAVNIESQIIIRCGDISINPRPNQSLSCFIQNVRSLKAFRAVEGSFESKLGLLQDTVYGHDFDIICLTETWLKSEFFDLEVNLVEMSKLKYDRSILVVNAYRPPNSTEFVTKFSELLKSLRVLKSYHDGILLDCSLIYILQVIESYSDFKCICGHQFGLMK